MLRAANLALDLDARNWWAHDLRALAITALGDPVRAVDGYEPKLMTTTPYAVGNFGYMLARAGRRREAEEQRYLLVEHGKYTYVPPTSVAAVCAGLGLVDEVFSWLNRAVEERDAQLAFCVTGYITIESVRSDSRFADIRRRVRL
jgi:hypothetical protein